MISIIIPSYNEEESIERCLQSLSNQTIPRYEYEIIVVDGNSVDRTREIADKYADLVFIQESKLVGGARNDGFKRARGNIVATTDADCIIPKEWVERVLMDFSHPDVVQIYGPVYPVEPGFKHKISLFLANNFSKAGYYLKIWYFTLGCNTAFRREAFIKAGMYRCIDAGDDLEIAVRMKKEGKVLFDNSLRVGFSMRRYQKFGTLKSLYEWLYIVHSGGASDKYSYSHREYK